MRALLVLPLLLSGCSLFGGSDGTYLVTLKLKSDSCNEDNPTIGQEQQMLASMYRTGSNNLVFEIGGMLLTGPPAEGSDFQVGYEQGTISSYDGCDSYRENASFEIEGTFSDDLGFEGNGTSSESVVREGCPDDEEEVCTYKFNVTALKLDAARERRPTGSIAWGYFGGSSY